MAELDPWVLNSLRGCIDTGIKEFFDIESCRSLVGCSISAYRIRLSDRQKEMSDEQIRGEGFIVITRALIAEGYDVYQFIPGARDEQDKPIYFAPNTLYVGRRREHRVEIVWNFEREESLIEVPIWKAY